MKVHDSHGPAVHVHGPEGHGEAHGLEAHGPKNEKALEHLQDKFDKVQDAADHVRHGSPGSVQQVVDATEDVVNEARQAAANAPPGERGQAEQAVHQVEQAAHTFEQQVQAAAADTHSDPAQLADKVKEAANQFFSTVASAFEALLQLAGESSSYFQAALSRAQLAVTNIEHTARSASGVWNVEKPHPGAATVKPTERK